KQNLKDKIAAPRTLTPAPAFPYAAFLRYYAVKQNEAHHAVDVQEQNRQHQPGHDEHRDQRGIDHGIEPGQADFEKALGVIWRCGYLEAAGVAASPTGTHFAG